MTQQIQLKNFTLTKDSYTLWRSNEEQTEHEIQATWLQSFLQKKWQLWYLNSQPVINQQSAVYGDDGEMNRKWEE